MLVSISIQHTRQHKSKHYNLNHNIACLKFNTVNTVKREVTQKTKNKQLFSENAITIYYHSIMIFHLCHKGQIM